MPIPARNRHHSPRHASQKQEILGLILILFLILALTIARSWHHIPWRAR